MHERLHVVIPPTSYSEAIETAKLIDNDEKFPFLKGVESIHKNDPVMNYLAETWYPALTICGLDGIPSVQDAGNVIRSKISLMLSVRTPPTLKCQEASDWLCKELERDPPYNAKIAAKPLESGSGWNKKEETERFSNIV